jgi:hypothetical protein
MPSSEVAFQSSGSAAHIVKPIFAGVFFICMFYCAHKLWRARNQELKTVKQVFGLCTVFFGIKGFAWLIYVINVPLFVSDLIFLWPTFIQVTVAERLASTWLEVYYTFTSVITTRDFTCKVMLISTVLNISVHLVFLISYCVLYEFGHSLLGRILRSMLVLFMLYVVILMTFSVKRISSVIKEFLDPKFSRKIKLIGVFTVISFTLDILVNLTAIYLTPREYESMINAYGAWLPIALIVEYAVVTIAFMLVVSRAILAQARSNLPAFHGDNDNAQNSSKLLTANS